jgi:uncharacterized protein (DUF2141 family)
MNTEELITAHRSYNAAIDACATVAQLGEGEQTAKNWRCALKTEIAKRARRGDVSALAYAQQRGWPIEKPVRREHASAA